MRRKFLTGMLFMALLSAGFVACGDDEPTPAEQEQNTENPGGNQNGTENPGGNTEDPGNKEPELTEEEKQKLEEEKKRLEEEKAKEEAAKWAYPVDIFDVTTGELTTGDGVNWPIANHRPYETGSLRAAIDYSKHPIFRLACAISSYNLNKTSAAGKVVLQHFDEVTLENEMKYSSIVRGDGSMDFSTVKRSINFCKQNNIGIFGHTLAWHSQQQVGYLNGLVSKGTDEEKKEALIKELERWIGGCMEACDGYITCWDAVNEALAEDGNYKGLDFYNLQGTGKINSNNLNQESSNFFWQDYLGWEDYVPTVIRIAREKFEEYGGDPNQLKLFINDYNLESDWNDNKKLKSLIKWLEIWESKEGCYVDGIGTQMHISCYANDSYNESKKQAIVEMFKLMAATGKLCKISELDMGFKRRGNEQWYSPAVQYDQLTAEEAKKMADLYDFVVTKYFEIIPPEQQFGITQWVLADSPKQPNYIWRHGEPAGFWKLNFKGEWPMFNGFMKGLLNSNNF